MAGKHSIYAPSSLHRVAKCPASWRINIALPDTESVYSARGTFGHSIADKCFQRDCDAGEYLDHEETVLVNGIPHTFVADARFINAIQSYLDWCREVPGTMYYERSVDITPWTPSRELEFGTLDNTVMAPGHLTITDLKLGEGEKVMAKANLQLLDYALATWKEFDPYYSFKKVAIRIAQPLLNHMDVWEIDVPTLLRWGGYIKTVWLRAAEPNPPFGPDEHACRFCKIRHNCSELARATEEPAALYFDEIVEDFAAPDVKTLSDEDLVIAWRTFPLLKARMKAVQDHLQQRTLAGHGPALGLKMVAGRAIRYWRSEEEAEEAMAAVGIPPAEQRTSKLITPATAEGKVRSKVKREALQPAIVQPFGKPVLVAADDPRESIDTAHLAVFDDETDSLEHEEDEL